MSDSRASYPDISEILARKAEGRRQRAKMSFTEKLAALDALRERVRPLQQNRAQNPVLDNNKRR
jgi:hypothetical protein